MTHVVMVDSNTPGVLAFEAAQRRGYRTSFLHARGPHEVFYRGALADRVFGAADDVIEVSDSSDENIIEGALRDLHAASPIDAVFTCWHPCVLPLARAAHSIGLRFTDQQGALYGAHKDLGRERLLEAGVPSIDFAVVDGRDGAHAAAERIGFPLIAKPACGVGKFFTQIVHDRAELDAAILAYEEQRRATPPILHRSFESKLMLEEYMSGPMISAEVAAFDGHAIVIGLSSRRRARHNEIIELGSTMPPAISAEDDAAARAYALAVTRAFGLDIGLFHIEIMLTPKGPRLIEANPRLAGGALPAAFSRSLGTSMFEMLLDIHVGEPMSLPNTPPTPLTMVRFASRDGGTVAEHDLGWIRDYDSHVVEFQFTARPGQYVPPISTNLDYIGTMMLRADTPARADELADEILERMSRSVGFAMAV